MDMIFKNAISPFHEMAAYEALWKQYGTFKKIADLFREHPNANFSEFVQSEEIEKMKSFLDEQFKEEKISFRIHGCYDYPQCIRDAHNPIEALYFKGNWNLIESPRRIAIVGSRKVSNEGILRTKKLAKLFIENDYVITSGLARGVDTVAHQTAIKNGGKTVAVIGTPINKIYPPENQDLQNEIARNHLLISQVPIWKYQQQNYKINRQYFPERNVTMSALTQATVIVEAENNSGTLIQARAALAQGRKLFILNSCFSRNDLTWPRKFLEKGAIIVRDFDDILQNI